MDLELDGVVIVREFLTGSGLSLITNMIRSAFHFLDEGGGDDAMRELWKAGGGLWLPNLKRTVGPKVAQEVYYLLEIEANNAIGPSYLAVDICNIRRMTKKIRFPWHNDYHGAGTWPYDPCFNIWIPLTPVGRGQPTVEVIRGSHSRMRELDLPLTPDRQYSEEWVADHFDAGAHLVPELAPGDALIFDHWALHRTQPVNGPLVSRVSIECRVTQKADYLQAMR